MHFHVLLILLLGTPSWFETCRILIKNDSRGFLINNAFCCFWARSRSLAKNTEWPKKTYTLLQQFGGFDSVWMPMVVT